MQAVVGKKLFASNHFHILHFTALRCGHRCVGIHCLEIKHHHIKSIRLGNVQKRLEAVFCHKIIAIDEKQILALCDAHAIVSCHRNACIGLMHHLHLWVFFGIAVAYLACGVGRAIVHGNHFVI